VTESVTVTVTETVTVTVTETVTVTVTEAVTVGPGPTQRPSPGLHCSPRGPGTGSPCDPRGARQLLRRLGCLQTAAFVLLASLTPPAPGLLAPTGAHMGAPQGLGCVKVAEIGLPTPPASRGSPLSSQGTPLSPQGAAAV